MRGYGPVNAWIRGYPGIRAPDPALAERPCRRRQRGQTAGRMKLVKRRSGAALARRGPAAGDPPAKYWSNTGQTLVRRLSNTGHSAALARRGPVAGDPPAKCWSNTGQLLVKSWSNTGHSDALARRGPAAGDPAALPPPDAGSKGWCANTVNE
jgi:hypothetical protein